MTQQRPIFSSRIATLITMVGVSVGLGNIWRFPYMMGSYGGSAFLVVYLIFTILFAIPAVSVEWSLGRLTRSGPVNAFSKMWGTKAGNVVGIMLLITVCVAESYYLYVIANITFSNIYFSYNGFSNNAIGHFKMLLNAPMIQYSIVLVLLALSFIVLDRGLKKGIETISMMFVPLFVLVMVFLIVFALTRENAGQYLWQFLSPDFSLLKPVHIFAALGQAFFSLGLGGTFLLVFGSYLRKDEPLIKSAMQMAFGDVSAALLAGLFIVPTILVLGLNMSQGPGLIFSTLPELFQRLPAGRLSGSLFLFVLLAMTFISSIAALEVLIAGFSELVGKYLNRRKLILIICGLEGLLILPIAFKPEIISTLDLIFGSGMQMLGSLLTLLTFCWGQSTQNATHALFLRHQAPYQNLFFYWVKWVVPVVIASVLVGYVISKIQF